MDCLPTVKPVAEAMPVDGSVMRETASEREAWEEESLNVLRKVRQAAQT